MATTTTTLHPIELKMDDSEDGGIPPGSGWYTVPPQPWGRMRSIFVPPSVFSIVICADDTVSCTVLRQPQRYDTRMTDVWFQVNIERHYLVYFVLWSNIVCPLFTVCNTTSRLLIGSSVGSTTVDKFRSCLPPGIDVNFSNFFIPNRNIVAKGSQTPEDSCCRSMKLGEAYSSPQTS